MSQVLEFEPVQRIIRVTIHGELTDTGVADLYALVHRFLQDHEVRGGILDLSPVTSLAVRPEKVREMAKNPPLFQGADMRVIVAPSDLLFGMSRLFQISRTDVHGDLHVVHTMEEAYRMHGLESPSFEIITTEN